MITSDQMADEMIAKLGKEGAIYCVDLFIDVTRNYDNFINQFVGTMSMSDRKILKSKSEGHLFWQNIKEKLYEKST